MLLASTNTARAWRRALLLAWLVLLLPRLAPPLRAQTVRWHKTFGLTYTYDSYTSATNSINAAVVTPDGGFLLAGHAAQNMPGATHTGTYGLVVKVDTAGNELWKKSCGLTYTSNSYTYAENNLTAAVATPDGGFLLAGNTSQYIPGTTYTGVYGLVVKVDADGNVRWQKTCGLTHHSTFNYLHAAVATPDGGFLLAGNTSQYIPGSAYTGQYGLVVKVDASGNVLWQKTCGLTYTNLYGNTYAENNLSAVVATPDGGFLLAGTTHQNISGNPSFGYYGLVVKVDASGNVLWQKTNGLTYTSNSYTYAYNHLHAAVATPEGGFLLAGQSSQIVPGTTNLGTYGLVVKVDANGQVLSQQTCGLPYTSGTYTYAHNTLHAAVATPDGGFLLAGQTYQNIPGTTYMGQYGLVVKVDASGQELWPQPYTVPRAAGLTGSSLKAAAATQGGGVLLAGYGYQYPGTPVGNYGWAIRLDSVAVSLLKNPSFEAAAEDTARWVASPPDWYHYQGQPALGPLQGQPLAQAADGQTYLALAAYHQPDSLYHEAIMQPLTLQNEATYLFELDLAHSPLELTQVLLGRWKSPARLQVWLTKSLEGDFGYVSMQAPQLGVKIYEQQPETSTWKRYKFSYTVPPNSDFQYLIVRASADSTSPRALVLVDHVSIFKKAQAGTLPAQARSQLSGSELAAAGAHPAASPSALKAYPNPVSHQLTVEVELAQAGPVSLERVDLLGQRRVLLPEQPLGAGLHRLEYATGSWPPGLYLLRLRQGARLWQVKVLKP